MDKALEKRLDRIEAKLDRALVLENSFNWMKLMLSGAWAAIAGLFMTK